MQTKPLETQVSFSHFFLLCTGYCFTRWDEEEDREIDCEENVSKNEDGFSEDDWHLIASVLTSRMLLCKRILSEEIWLYFQWFQGYDFFKIFNETAEIVFCSIVYCWLCWAFILLFYVIYSQ